MAQESIQQAILQMTQILQKLAQPTPAPSNPEKTLEALATNISEFSFDPDKGITFEKWFSRYTDCYEPSFSGRPREGLALSKSCRVVTEEKQTAAEWTEYLILRLLTSPSR